MQRSPPLEASGRLTVNCCTLFIKSQNQAHGPDPAPHQYCPYSRNTHIFTYRLTHIKLPSRLFYVRASVISPVRATRIVRLIGSLRAIAIFGEPLDEKLYVINCSTDVKIGRIPPHSRKFYSHSSRFAVLY